LAIDALTQFMPSAEHVFQLLNGIPFNCYRDTGIAKKFEELHVKHIFSICLAKNFVVIGKDIT